MKNKILYLILLSQLSIICNSPQAIDASQALKDLNEISSSLNILGDTLVRSLAALKKYDETNKQNIGVFNNLASVIAAILPNLKKATTNAADVTKQLDEMQKR